MLQAVPREARRPYTLVLRIKAGGNWPVAPEQLGLRSDRRQRGVDECVYSATARLDDVLAQVAMRLVNLSDLGREDGTALILEVWTGRVVPLKVWTGSLVGDSTDSTVECERNAHPLRRLARRVRRVCHLLQWQGRHAPCPVRVTRARRTTARRRPTRRARMQHTRAHELFVLRPFREPMRFENPMCFESLNFESPRIP